MFQGLIDLPEIVFAVLVISVFGAGFYSMRRAQVRISEQMDAQIKAIEVNNEISERNSKALERIAVALESFKK
jgi:hypothetical protein